MLFAAGLVIGMGALAYTSGRAALRSATIAGLLSTAIEKQAALDNWVHEAQVNMNILATTHDLRVDVAKLAAAEPGSAAASEAHDHVLNHFENWTGADRPFAEVLVIAPESGRVIVATDANEEGTFKEDRAYFIQGRHELYVQNPHYALRLRAPTMVVSAPLRGDDGRLLAVLAGRLNLERMNIIISRRTGLNQTDDAFLVNSSNLFVTQPRFISDPAVLRRGIHTESVKHCLSKQSGVILAPGYRGIPAIIVYRWLPDRQLCLIVKVDEAEALAPARTFGWTILLIGGLTLLLAATLAFWLSRSITRPVIELRAGAAQLAAGNLALRLPAARGDELGDLAREFNAMAAVISEKDADLRAYATDLEWHVETRTAELREQRDLYQQILQGLSDMGEGFLIAEGQRMIYANDAYCAISGYAIDELLAMPSLMPLIPPAEQPILAERIEMLERGQLLPGLFEASLINKAGCRVELEVSSKAIRLHSSDQRISIIRDITERKRADEALVRQAQELARSNADLEQFAYAASHDLQEPLRMITSFTDLLARRYHGKLDERADQFLMYIVDGASRMQQLINDLLTYSRVGREHNVHPIDCAVVMRQVLNNLQIAIEESGAIVITNSLPIVHADESHLMRLFQNLVGNAIKFCGADPPRIEISATRDEQAWRFAVRDNGIGIDAQYAERIFEIFQRLHTRQEYPGTGIGLAICKKIVERYGGRIWVDTDSKQGSTFLFTIPDYKGNVL